MAQVSDVRSNIPFTDQTNPAKFPPYERREYPKMMLQPDGKPFRDEATGNPITVAGVDEEHAFRAEHPEAQQVTSTSKLNSAERAELEQLRAERAGGADGGNKLAKVAPAKPPAKAAAPKPGGQRLKDKDGRPLPAPL